jgi:mRNA interferase YafQ
MVVKETSRFKKDYRRIRKQGKDLSVLKGVIITLAIPEPLDKSFNSHSLSGDWTGWYECHLASDWLLIYRYETTGGDSMLLRLGRTGSHAELFE